MADRLIIVESPAKANTIKKFLGGSTKVVASMGHIRDLPKSKMGIDIEHDFEPQYINIRGKGDLIKSLKKYAKQAKTVYLATDPDREGEAIAWHLATILNDESKKITRVTFNEITKTAVQKAIKEPRNIDINLVDAQQARRVLDRIVGYKISPVLWKKVKRGLSAGRVQSVAVKLIVDREEEIEKFIPEEYWNIYADLKEEKSKKIFQARYFGKNGKKQEIHSQEETNKILENIKNAKYTVTEVKKGERKRTPAPPFTTSTMQQEASRKLGFTLKKTMSVAQGLYEGVKISEKGTVGLITYMRTDSTRISEEARAAAKEQIIAKYGEKYYENRYYKTGKDAQDAHEGIRPTYINIDPDSIKDELTLDQYKLYKLIYNRFMASQMKPAVYDTMAVNIKANEYDHRDDIDGNDNSISDNNAETDVVDTEQLQYQIGDCVEYNTIYASSTSESGLTPSEGFNSGTITRVIPWAVNPYLINNGTGWVNDCCIISSDNSNDEGCDNADIKVGDKVRVILNVDYDTDRAFNLYYDEYDVIQINGDRAVIGIGNTVTSAINIRNIERV